MTDGAPGPDADRLDATAAPEPGAAWVESGAGPTRSIRGRLAQARPLLVLLAVREVRTRYRQSALNLLWSIITPVVVLAVYGVILTNAFEVGGDGAPYLAVAWTGLALWGFFAAAVGAATTSILSAGDLVSKVYFPRETLPLAAVGAALLDLGVGLAVLLALVVGLGVGLSVHALALVPAVALLVVFAAGVSVFTSLVTVFVRDTSHAVGLALRVGFFATPVMYLPSVLPDSLAWLAWANPVAVSIEAARDGLLYHRWPDWQLLGVQGVIVAVLWVASISYAARVEARVVDEL